MFRPLLGLSLCHSRAVFQHLRRYIHTHVEALASYAEVKANDAWERGKVLLEWYDNVRREREGKGVTSFRSFYQRRATEPPERYMSV